MREKAFIDKQIQPTTDKLQTVLKQTYDYYRMLMELTKEFEQKWTFYKGWSLKIYKKNKALCYTT